MEKSNHLPIYSVGDFITSFNQITDQIFPVVYIEGEVSSFKTNQNKYIFFDLKDEKNSISCFMMIWQLRTPITDGMHVIIEANVKLTNFGKFSLTVRSIKPLGEGDIKKSYEILKRRLDKEGLFKIDRKRALPVIPKYIGVISSQQAAGYADFIKILNDRWGGIKIDVANVQVQGSSSADQIIGAINYFNQLEILPEVLVIIRGGGSLDDLASFNDEQLAYAVAKSRIPILSGIGHETDETLIDLVADRRASTPSNAAQILVPDKETLLGGLHDKINLLVTTITKYLEQYQVVLNDKLQNVFDSVTKKIDDQANDLNKTSLLLEQLNPESILARGYALIRGNLKIGDRIEIEIVNKIAQAEVKDVKNK